MQCSKIVNIQVQKATDNTTVWQINFFMVVSMGWDSKQTKFNSAKENMINQERIECPYSFDVRQSGLRKNVLLQPNLIVFPICVFETWTVIVKALDEIPISSIIIAGKEVPQACT